MRDFLVRVCLAKQMIPIDLAIFVVSNRMWFFQVSPESKIKPKNLVVLTTSRVLPSMRILMSELLSLRGGPKIIICVLSTLSESLLALSQSISSGISLFKRDSMSLRFGPEVNTFESSANIIVDILFEIVPRSFM